MCEIAKRELEDHRAGTITPPCAAVSFSLVVSDRYTRYWMYRRCDLFVCVRPFVIYITHEIMLIFVNYFAETVPQ